MAEWNVYFTKQGRVVVEADTYQEATVRAEAIVEADGEPETVWEEWSWEETYETFEKETK